MGPAIRWLAALAAAASFAGCPICTGEGELRLLEGETTLAPGEQAQFEYRWEGQVRSTPGDCGAVWTVDDVVGGDAMRGTIDECGLYTAPATTEPRTVTVVGSDHGPFCADCCPYARETVRIVPAAPRTDGGM